MGLKSFFQELLWSFYLPKYREISEKKFKSSLRYMSAVLLIAFLLSGVLYLPKLFLLKNTIEDELSKFDVFKVSGDVKQNAPVTIPKHNPWVVIDLNNEVEMNKEIFVIDKETIKYRLFRVNELPRDQIKDISAYRVTVSAFLAIILILMLPGIALLLYIRLWLKYFLLTILMGTFFFIILDLTRWKLRWKQMLNIAAHTITAVIIIEVLSAFVTTWYLIPFMKFVGVSVYLVSLIIYAGLMIYGIVGTHMHKEKEK